MRIAILSQYTKSYSVRRLKEEGSALDHSVRVLAPTNFAVSVEARNPKLFYKHKKLRLPDAVIPRISAQNTFFGTSVLRQFEQMGVFTVNTSHAVLASRDKLRALQILSRHDIGITPTEIVHSGSSVLESIERLGGAPVIIKTIQGTQGTGVMLAETTKGAEAIVQALHNVQQNVLIQKFVKESRGQDVRAFVVGRKVVAAMRRRAVGDEFRSNVHRGGKTEVVELPEEYERAAVRAAQVLGLRVAGVDLLESDEGPQVMEVNSSPGLEGIETATGKNVARMVIEHTADQAKFLEVDVKQEPTAAEYGLVELPVGQMLKGQRIRETVLFEQHVLVLRIKRGDQTIPTPPSDTKLLNKDQLLCYGELHFLKNLLPEKRRR